MTPTPINVSQMNSIVANDSIKMNKEQQFKIQEITDASIKGDSSIKHQFHTTHETQKMKKLMKATKTHPLKMPPSLSDVDLGRIYNDLIVDYKEDMMGSRFDFINDKIMGKCGCGTSFNFSE